MSGSKIDGATATIADLRDEFSRIASGMRSSARPGPYVPDPRPEAEKEAARSRLRQVIGDLRERASLKDVLPLFENENDDVRGIASTALASFDEELGRAAYGGVANGVPTSQALALMRGARALNRANPPLEQMKEDEVLARFVEVATCLYGTRFFEWLGDDGNGCSVDDWDSTNRNHWVQEEILALRELKARGALTRLIPFLDDSNPVIQVEAAKACLAISTDKAVAILEAHAANIGFGAENLEATWARAALDNWRAGKPVIWGVV